MIMLRGGDVLVPSPLTWAPTQSQRQSSLCFVKLQSLVFNQLALILYIFIVSIVSSAMLSEEPQFFPALIMKKDFPISVAVWICWLFLMVISACHFTGNSQFYFLSRLNTSWQTQESDAAKTGCTHIILFCQAELYNQLPRVVLILYFSHDI